VLEIGSQCRPDGVDRIIEVALSDNADLDAEVIALEGVIAAYASRHARPAIPFWPMLFANVTVRLIGSDDFAVATERDAANDLTTAAADGKLSIAISDPLPLERIAEAHDRLDAGTRGRILLTMPQSSAAALRGMKLLGEGAGVIRSAA
jgi:NADPH:quinone reductase